MHKKLYPGLKEAQKVSDQKCTVIVNDRSLRGCHCVSDLEEKTRKRHATGEDSSQ